MRKAFLKSTAIALFFIGVLTSCSNEDKSDNSSQVDIKTFMKELDTLNEDILAKYDGTCPFPTRGNYIYTNNPDLPELEEAKLKWWKRLLAVVAADAVGAACGNAAMGPIGGAVVGIGASLEMFRETGCMSAIDKQDLSNNELSAYTIVMDSINHNMNNNISNFDLIGDCHNIVLRDILNNKNVYLNEDGSLKENVVIEKIKSSVKAMGYDVSNINSSSVKTQLNKISASRANVEDFNFEAQINNYASLFPDKKDEMVILKNYIVTAASLPNVTAVKEYSALFENKVYNTQIQGFDKAFLLAGESVAKNSAIGWNISTSPTGFTRPQ